MSLNYGSNLKKMPKYFNSNVIQVDCDVYQDSKRTKIIFFFCGISQSLGLRTTPFTFSAPISSPENKERTPLVLPSRRGWPELHSDASLRGSFEGILEKRVQYVFMTVYLKRNLVFPFIPAIPCLLHSLLHLTISRVWPRMGGNAPTSHFPVHAAQAPSTSASDRSQPSNLAGYECPWPSVSRSKHLLCSSPKTNWNTL